MAIEAMNTAGVSYQGSNQEPAGKAVKETKEAKEMPQKEVTISKPVENKKSVFTALESEENEKKPEEKATQAPSESLKKAVDEINKKAKNSEAVFGIHDATNHVTIKIINRETKEVMKEYPPEKTLDMIAKVWELAGLLVDEKR
ncbi:MAG: flagellar protein FlaG [Lachnospiraceae bacterium]